MKTTASGWARKKFKGNKVWVATDKTGCPLIQNNKVLIKYQLDQDYEYWVVPDHISELDADDLIKQKTAPPRSVRKKSPPPGIKMPSPPTAPVEGVITVFTDGASSGNPGPSGIGIFMEYGRHEREISRYIGITTNNVAELKAVEIALTEIKRKDFPVRIYTDSKYVYSLLCEGWKAKKNTELIHDIKKLMSEFSDIKIIKIKGHAGIAGNERADRMATNAIASRK
ncbi:MAG: ribonuclease HI [Desulfobacterales bacterium]|jgi:ribonuclease HI|nr:ribonuclease HI [Desulfobacterales bacterium]